MYLLTSHVADLEDVHCDPGAGAGGGGEEQGGHAPLPALQAHGGQGGVGPNTRHLHRNITKK